MLVSRLGRLAAYKRGRAGIHYRHKPESPLAPFPTCSIQPECLRRGNVLLIEGHLCVRALSRPTEFFGKEGSNEPGCALSLIFTESEQGAAQQEIRESHTLFGAGREYDLSRNVRRVRRKRLSQPFG